MALGPWRIRIDADCPGELELRTLRYGLRRVDLKVPVRVTLSEKDGEFLMENREIEIWGAGRTPRGAYRDFSGAFIGAYELFGLEDDEQARAIRRHVEGDDGDRVCRAFSHPAFIRTCLVAVA